MKKLTLLIFVLGFLSACTASPVTPTESSDTGSKTDSSDASNTETPADQTETVAFAQVQSIVQARCFECHGDGASRGGVNFDATEDIQAKASRIKFRSVDNQTMPPNNKTSMTDAEREILGQWIAQGAKLD